jgi:hypothetical protein
LPQSMGGHAGSLNGPDARPRRLPPRRLGLRGPATTAHWDRPLVTALLGEPFFAEVDPEPGLPDRVEILAVAARFHHRGKGGLRDQVEALRVDPPQQLRRLWVPAELAIEQDGFPLDDQGVQDAEEAMRGPFAEDELALLRAGGGRRLQSRRTRRP